MKRLAAAVVSILVAVVLCVVGRVDAADDPLTPEMAKDVDASLIVFVGQVASIERGRDGDWLVSYKVERYLKGTCVEPRLVVVQTGASERSAAKDAAPQSVGSRVIVGARLVAASDRDYRLWCKSARLGGSTWTQPLEDSIASRVASAPHGPTTPNSKPDRPDPLPQKPRLTCMEHLAQLGYIFMTHMHDDAAKARKYSGPALWLAMRKNAIDLQRGEENVLLCPADPAVRAPRTDADRKAWDEVDLAKPTPGLCSYVGRDFVNFPIDIASSAKQPIGACLHHEGGAVVVFESGDAQFVTLEDLGLSSEDEKKVGPDSKSPILRKLR
jgi:hypothetical protein